MTDSGAGLPKPRRQGPGQMPPRRVRMGRPKSDGSGEPAGLTESADAEGSPDPARSGTDAPAAEPPPDPAAAARPEAPEGAAVSSAPVGPVPVPEASSTTSQAPNSSHSPALSSSAPTTSGASTRRAEQSPRRRSADSGPGVLPPRAMQETTRSSPVALAALLAGGVLVVGAIVASRPRPQPLPAANPVAVVTPTRSGDVERDSTSPLLAPRNPWDDPNRAPVVVRPRPRPTPAAAATPKPTPTPEKPTARATPALPKAAYPKATPKPTPAPLTANDPNYYNPYDPYNTNPGWAPGPQERPVATPMDSIGLEAKVLSGIVISSPEPTDKTFKTYRVRMRFANRSPLPVVYCRVSLERKKEQMTQELRLDLPPGSAFEQDVYFYGVPRAFHPNRLRLTWSDPDGYEYTRAVGVSDGGWKPDQARQMPERTYQY